jgi:hypothetical protein
VQMKLVRLPSIWMVARLVVRERTRAVFAPGLLQMNLPIGNRSLDQVFG